MAAKIAAGRTYRRRSRDCWEPPPCSVFSTSPVTRTTWCGAVNPHLAGGELRRRFDGCDTVPADLSGVTSMNDSTMPPVSAWRLSIAGSSGLVLLDELIAEQDGERLVPHVASARRPRRGPSPSGSRWRLVLISASSLGRRTAAIAPDRPLPPVWPPRLGGGRSGRPSRSCRERSPARCP